MARPYSNDLRERVAAAVGAGRSCREVAALFACAAEARDYARMKATAWGMSRPTILKRWV